MLRLYVKLNVLVVSDVVWAIAISSACNYALKMSG